LDHKAAGVVDDDWNRIIIGTFQDHSELLDMERVVCTRPTTRSENSPEDSPLFAHLRRYKLGYFIFCVLIVGIGGIAVYLISNSESEMNCENSNNSHLHSIKFGFLKQEHLHNKN